MVAETEGIVDRDSHWSGLATVGRSSSSCLGGATLRMRKSDRSWLVVVRSVARERR